MELRDNSEIARREAEIAKRATPYRTNGPIIVSIAGGLLLLLVLILL